MRLTERRDCTTDLTHKSYLFVDLCDEKAEQNLLEGLERLLNEWGAFAKEKQLPHIHIKIPYLWNAMEAQLQAHGFSEGIFFLKKNVEGAGRIPAGIERINDAFQIENMIREQQRLHVEFDPDFFEALATFDIRRYIQEFQDILKRGAGSLFVIKEGKTPIAHCALTRSEDIKSVTLYELFVDAVYRRGGLGRGLIDAAINYSASIGAATLMTTVAAKNTRAQAFYASCGFRPHAKLFYV